MIMTRSSDDSVNTSPVTVLSVSPLERESMDTLVDKCELLELHTSSSTAWELPTLEKEEESNHLVQNVMGDLQQAQQSGSASRTCEAWNALGLIRLHTRRNPSGALECHEIALQLITSSNTQAKCMQEATTLNDIGLCYERLEQTKEAVLAYEQAMEMMKEGISPTHPQRMSLERTMARLSRT